MKRMADAIYASNLPPGFDAYLGYVDGSWPDWWQVKARFPNVPVFGLTVFASLTSGDGTDIEPGNASIPSAVTACHAELNRGVDRPIVYCPASWADQVVNALAISQIPRTKYRLLTAHYGAGEHICGPSSCRYGPGADGTQWANHGSYDESVLLDSFLTATPHPGPPSPIKLPSTPSNGGAMSTVIVTLPIGSNGIGWGVFDGGINSDPGSASLFPAIPWANFTSAVAYCDDPAHDTGPATPKIGIQERNGYVFIKADGAKPGNTVVAVVVHS